MKEEKYSLKIMVDFFLIFRYTNINNHKCSDGEKVLPIGVSESRRKV